MSQHPHSHPSHWVARVNEVAETAYIAKMAQKNCIRARPILPHTNPME